MSSMLGNPGIRAPTGSNPGASATGGNIIPKGYKYGQIGQFTPEQIQLFQRMFGQVGPDSFLGKLAGGDQSMFEQLEAPAMRQFGDIQANIANRFSGMGMGAQKSSGFRNAQTEAGADFAQALQSQRLGLQNQAIRDMMEMSGQLLQQRPYEQFLLPKKQPFWKELLGGLIPGLGTAGGTLGGLWGGKKLGLFGD